MRDSARGLPGALSEKLEKSHLVNQFEEGLDHFKLLPTQTNGDRTAFLALIKGDLIRNYFLMRVTAAEQEKLFQRCWEPMQLRLKEELSEFVRHFLMRQGAIVKKGEIYRTLKERTDEQTPDGIAAFLDELHRSAVHYHRLLDPSQELNPDLHPRLRRFERLEVSVTWPLMLNLYAEHDAGSLSIGEFTAILDTL